VSAQTNRTRGLWHIQLWVSFALLERCLVDEVIQVARSAPGVLQ
jgi:hypothetical protein